MGTDSSGVDEDRVGLATIVLNTFIPTKRSGRERECFANLWGLVSGFVV